MDDKLKKTVEIPTRVSQQLHETKVQYESIISDLKAEVTRLNQEISALRDKTANQLSMNWAKTDEVEGDFADVFQSMIMEHEKKLDDTLDELQKMCVQAIDTSTKFILRLLVMKKDRSKLLKPMTKG